MDLPVQVYWISRYSYRADSELRVHKHDYFQAMLICEGTGTVEFDMTEYAFRPDTLFFVPPGHTHGLTSGKSGTVITLDIKFAVGDETLASALCALPASMSPPPPEARNLLERIRDCGDSQGPLFRELSNTLLLELCLLLARRGAVSGAWEKDIGTRQTTDPICAGAIAIIAARYMTDLSQRQIAREIGCPASTLGRRFADHVGTTVMSFLQRTRIEKAKELIRYSDFAIKQVSAQTGFKTVHHFTRTFTRIVGLSPAAWRSRERGGVRKSIYFIDQAGLPEYE